MTQYSSDGKGNWWKTVWEEQCPEFVGIGGILAKIKDGEEWSTRHLRCQGVKGHKGLHWRYGPCGSYEWDDNEEDSTEEGCCGTTPPDHKKYVAPQRKCEEHWMNFKTTTKVEDPEKIAALERGEYEDGAGVDKPVDFDEMDPETREEIQERMGIRKAEPRLFYLVRDGDMENTIPIVTIDPRDARCEIGNEDHGAMPYEIWDKLLDQGDVKQIKKNDCPTELMGAIPFGEVNGCMYDFTCSQWCQMMDENGVIHLEE